MDTNFPTLASDGLVHNRLTACISARDFSSKLHPSLVRAVHKMHMSIDIPIPLLKVFISSSNCKMSPRLSGESQEHFLPYEFSSTKFSYSR